MAMLHSQQNEAPPMKEFPGGVLAKQAAVHNVVMRTVGCNDGGATATPAGAGSDASHIKAEVVAIHVKEKRLDSESGFFENYGIKLAKQERGKIAELRLELGGEQYDLLTSEGKMQFVFAKKATALPAQAVLSMRYTSPIGGDWFVEKHPIVVDFGEPRAGCCVLM